MSDAITVCDIEAEHAREMLASGKAKAVLGDGPISRNSVVRLVHARSARHGELFILVPRQIVGDVVIARYTVHRDFLVIATNCRAYWLSPSSAIVVQELVLSSPIFFMQGVGDASEMIVASDEIVCRASGSTICWTASASTRIADFDMLGGKGLLTTDDGRIVTINLDNGFEEK